MFQASLTEFGHYGRGVQRNPLSFADESLFSDAFFNCLLIYLKNIFTVTKLPKTEIIFCHHCHYFVIKT